MKLLIASTEKTGNTWLKLLLAQVYDLPTPYVEPDFSPARFDSLGERWVGHQHLVPDRPVLEWAAARDVRILTTIRHPAATLVSLYHYCCNYRQNYENEFEIVDALAQEVAQHGRLPNDTEQITDGPLIRILQRRLMCDLNISISWMVSGHTTAVRYEDLHANTFATLANLTATLGPATPEQIEKAIAHCQLKTLKERYPDEKGFFRRGSLDEWNTALPLGVCRRFVEEEPYKSQCDFLGYDLQSQLDQRTTLAQGSNQKKKGAGILVVPILRQLLESIGITKQTWFPEHLLLWANGPADAESAKGLAAIPLITNLAAFIHRLRPDLQAAFPDIFDANRVGYAIWFLRYAQYAYQLDQSFITPVALSWLRPKLAMPTTMS